MRCDVCHCLVNTYREYACPSFVVRLDEGPDMLSEGAWALCWECAPLAEVHDVEGMANRAMATIVAMSGAEAGRRARPRIRQVLRAFDSRRQLAGPSTG